MNTKDKNERLSSALRKNLKKVFILQRTLTVKATIINTKSKDAIQKLYDIGAAIDTFD